MSFENMTIEQLNALSPEEFAKLDADQVAALAASTDEDEGNGDDDNNSDDDSQNDQNENENNDDGQEDHSDDEQDENSQSENDEESEDDSQDDAQENDEDQHEDPNAQQQQQVKQTKQKQKQKQTQQQEEKVENEVATAEQQTAFYTEVTAPFNANGKQYQITDAKDAISLMQKGLDYNQKMNAIAPYRRAGQILEESGLLHDTERLAFLIDLHNKNPEAIAKLVQESGIDTFDLNEESANNYKPTPVNIVSDAVQNLRDVVANNKEDADFNAVFNEAMGWDDASQQLIMQDPSVLVALANHKKTGVYDQVMQQVNHAIHVQGNKTPVAQLYYQIGSSMNGNTGGNNRIAQAQNTQNKPSVQSNTQTKVTKQIDPNLASKRKILSQVKASNKKSAGSTKMSPEQMFNLSDEEFAKIDPTKLNIK